MAEQRPLDGSILWKRMPVEGGRGVSVDMFGFTSEPDISNAKPFLRPDI